MILFYNKQHLQIYKVEANYKMFKKCFKSIKHDLNCFFVQYQTVIHHKKRYRSVQGRLKYIRCVRY